MTIQEIHTEPRAGNGVDADRWPDVARLPNRALRAAIARRLVRAAVDRLALRVEIHPTGEVWGAGGPDTPLLRLVRADAVFDRLGDSGLIGFGEAYMAGDLVAGDRGVAPAVASAQLVDALTVMSEHLEDLFRVRCIGFVASASVASRPPKPTPSLEPARTSPVTTTCPMTCSRASWTRR